MYLLGTGLQRASKKSRILVQSTALTYASWSADCTGEDGDTTNFTSWQATGFQGGQSFDEGILCVVKSTWDCGGDWDAGTNPTDANFIPGLFPRDDLSNLQFLPDQAETPTWAYTYARVRSAKSAAAVRGKVSFQSSGMNQGLFKMPVGNMSVSAG